ncbi:MAG: 3-phosphoshikimate 1-carboxyvinyltransferase, partial [Clostridia bacterium]|nr:3-phosphoshikimate 1-carboxyvinyltransferase [Clostridia bacterium]
MKATITPSVLKGEIKAPPSKSMAHRLLISAGLSKGESVISSVAYSEDILATLDCLRVM